MVIISGLRAWWLCRKHPDIRIQVIGARFSLCLVGRRLSFGWALVRYNGQPNLSRWDLGYSMRRAEAGGAELFLTTDDRLVRRAQQNAQTIKVRVVNPAQWLTEA